MKRSRLTRKTRLKRGDSELKRTPINPVNRERRKEERLRAYGPPERRAWVKSLPCNVCGRSPVDQAHVPSQSGAGRKGDAEFVIPLCRRHHSELDHELGPGPFAAKHSINLHDAAREVAAAWERHSAD